MKTNLIKSILAGVFIGIGCNIYLSCDNKYIGSLLFTIGLITILYFSFNLYTGKVGYILNNNLKYIITLLIILLGNIIGAIFIGLLFPNNLATTLCNNKLSLSYYNILIKSIMCGLLIYIAVDSYSNNKNILLTIFCIPTFILLGYEHSIADIVYFSMARMFNIQTIIFLIIIILGNAIGSNIIPICNKLIKN